MVSKEMASDAGDSALEGQEMPEFEQCQHCGGTGLHTEDDSTEQLRLFLDCVVDCVDPDAESYQEMFEQAAKVQRGLAERQPEPDWQECIYGFIGGLIHQHKVAARDGLLDP